MASIEEIKNNPTRPMCISTGEPVAYPKDRASQKRRLAASEMAMERERQRIATGFPPGKYPQPVADNDNRRSAVKAAA